MDRWKYQDVHFFAWSFIHNFTYFIEHIFIEFLYDVQNNLDYQKIISYILFSLRSLKSSWRGMSFTYKRLSYYSMLAHSLIIVTLITVARATKLVAYLYFPYISSFNPHNNAM